MSSVRLVPTFAVLASLLAAPACLVAGFDKLLGRGDTTGPTSDSGPTTDGMGTTSGLPTGGVATTSLLTTGDASSALTATMDAESTMAATASSTEAVATEGTTSETTNDPSGETTETSNTTATSETTSECMGDCVPRRVFVTIGVYYGDFGMGGSVFMEADARCNTEAGDAMLPGTYKAWVSTNAAGPTDRFDTTFKGTYVLCDDNMTVVAHGWGELVGGSLDKAIDRDADGNVVMTSKQVYTGTKPNGTPASTCMDWNGPMALATVGLLDQTDGTWTESTTAMCTTEHRIYCFEDP